MEANGQDVVLARKYRPRKLDQVVGQSAAVKSIQAMLDKGKVPSTLLFTGPSGVGKTTLARILRRKLGCGGNDFCEINCGSVESAIETFRGIEQRMALAPIGGSCRVWLLDEVQSLSRTRFAQEALLKILEEAPTHCYFLLCTTDPGKLIKTVVNRATEVRLKPLAAKEIEAVVKAAAEGEKVKVPTAVLTKIVEAAEGSPRLALSALQKVISLESEADQLAAVSAADHQAAAFDIVRALIWKTSKWTDVVAIIEGLGPDQDWEGIRRLMSACAAKEVLKGNHWGQKILYAIQDPWFDCGRSRLIQACFEVMDGRGK